MSFVSHPDQLGTYKRCPFTTGFVDKLLSFRVLWLTKSHQQRACDVQRVQWPSTLKLVKLVVLSEARGRKTPVDRYA